MNLKNINSKNKLKVLTWHVHGSYLYYLTQTPCEFYLPVRAGRPEGYGGRSDSFPWGENVYDVVADKVKELDIDCILFQSKKNYLEDQYELLTSAQQELPKIYLEHDPPRETPTNTKHIVNDTKILLVHVTHFNNLMWNNNETPTKVIEHGVTIPDNVEYTGELEKGIVVVNNLTKRGRRLGLDVFKKIQKKIPLDLVGMGSEELGGLGEVPSYELPYLVAKYRFFFNPIRYTSLGLAVCEAMMAGMPIIALATTEMAVTVKNNIAGYIHTDISYLTEKMELLLKDKSKAKELSKGAKNTAKNKFKITRFTQDWISAFQDAIQIKNVKQKLEVRDEKENSIY